MRNPKEIVNEIRVLLGELEIVISAYRGEAIKMVPKELFSGLSGGIRLLLREGFFREQKTLSKVVERLHQEGFNYPGKAVSVALLRSVRKRFLVRLPSETKQGKEKWVYAERK